MGFGGGFGGGGFGGGGFGGGGFGGPGKGPSLGDYHAFKSTRPGSSSSSGGGSLRPGSSSGSGGHSENAQGGNRDSAWADIGLSLLITAASILFMFLLAQIQSCAG